jgi:hypothetical protein
MKQARASIPFELLAATPTELMYAGIPQTAWRKLDLETFADHRKHKLADPLYEVVRHSVWVEQELSAEWVAAFQLVPQGGIPVIAELRILPREPGRDPWRWKGNLLGVKAKVPRGGITSNITRAIRLSIPADKLLEFSALLRKLGPSVFDRVLGDAGFSDRTKRERALSPLARPDVFYAKVARDYDRLLQAGVHNVNQKLAAQRREPPSKIRDMVRRARKLGLLEPPAAQGKIGQKAGSRLTPKAEQLLRPQRKTKSNKAKRRK